MATTTLPRAAILKLMFPNGTDVPHLLPADAAKLPDSMIKMLVDSAARTTDMTDILVLHYDEDQLLETYFRLFQFAKDGKYAPLTGRASETYTRPPVTRGTTLQASTESTFASLKEEVKLFVLGMRSGCKALQTRSTKNILHEYPIYAHELVLLIRVLHDAQICPLTDTDGELAKMICERSKLLAKELKTDASCTALMHEIFKPRDRLAIALRGATDSVIDQLLDSLA
ncbi:hypothetical protein LTR95_012694 [Oleoguttula sp. CCFEE 5521]